MSQRGHEFGRDPHCWPLADLRPTDETRRELFLHMLAVATNKITPFKKKRGDWPMEKSGEQEPSA